MICKNACDHVITEHGDKVLKLRTIILNENTGKHEMMSKTLVSYQTMKLVGCVEA